MVGVEGKLKQPLEAAAAPATVMVEMVVSTVRSKYMTASGIPMSDLYLYQYYYSKSQSLNKSHLVPTHSDIKSVVRHWRRFHGDCYGKQSDWICVWYITRVPEVINCPIFPQGGW